MKGTIQFVLLGCLGVSLAIECVLGANEIRVDPHSDMYDWILTLGLGVACLLVAAALVTRFAQPGIHPKLNMVACLIALSFSAIQLVAYYFDLSGDDDPSAGPPWLGLLCGGLSLLFSGSALFLQIKELRRPTV